MPGIHHPTNPPDPAMLAPHPREECDEARCGMGRYRPGHVEPADVRSVALAYGSRDGYGVWYVYLPTLSRLMQQLADGIPAALIVAHAGHTGPECCALYRPDR